VVLVVVRSSFIVWIKLDWMATLAYEPTVKYLRQEMVFLIDFSIFLFFRNTEARLKAV
jgi:hypothetical protein